MKGEVKVVEVVLEVVFVLASAGGEKGFRNDGISDCDGGAGAVKGSAEGAEAVDE